MFKPTTLIIADDHPLLLNGLAMYLQEKGHSILAKVTDGQTALEAIQKHQPKIALLDIEMPQLSGLQVAEKCKALELSTKIILLSYHKTAAYALKAKQLNIRGYLAKDDALKNIDQCINSVLNGHLFFSKPIEALNLSEAQSQFNAIGLLTSSEKKILLQIAEGKSTTQIAEVLFISKRTVEKHRSNSISKLDLKGKAHELTQWCVQNKKLLE